MKGQWYWIAGFWPAAAVALIALVAAWIYCVSLFGLGIGFTLGWIPALPIAVLAYYVGRLLWAPLVGMLAMAALVTIGS